MDDSPCYSSVFLSVNSHLLNAQLIAQCQRYLFKLQQSVDETLAATDIPNLSCSLLSQNISKCNHDHNLTKHGSAFTVVLLVVLLYLTVQDGTRTCTRGTRIRQRQLLPVDFPSHHRSTFVFSRVYDDFKRVQLDVKVNNLIFQCMQKWLVYINHRGKLLSPVLSGKKRQNCYFYGVDLEMRNV